MFSSPWFCVRNCFKLEPIFSNKDSPQSNWIRFLKANKKLRKLLQFISTMHFGSNWISLNSITVKHQPSLCKPERQSAIKTAINFRKFFTFFRKQQKVFILFPKIINEPMKFIWKVYFRKTCSCGFVAITFSGGKENSNSKKIINMNHNARKLPQKDSCCL